MFAEVPASALMWRLISEQRAVHAAFLPAVIRVFRGSGFFIARFLIGRLLIRGLFIRRFFVGGLFRNDLCRRCGLFFGLYGNFAIFRFLCGALRFFGIDLFLRGNGGVCDVGNIIL